MSIVSYAHEFLEFVEHTVDTDTYLLIEDCGEIDPRMKGWYLCFDKSLIDRIVKHHQNLGADPEHFKRNYEKSPVAMISYPALQQGKKFTSVMLEHFGSKKEMLKAFGIVIEDEIEYPDDVSMDDIILDMGEEDDYQEDLLNDKEEADKLEDHVSETDVKDESDKDEIIDLDVEDEEVVNVEENRKVAEETAVTVEQTANSTRPENYPLNTYINPEDANRAIESLKAMNYIAEMLPQFKNNLEVLFGLMFGKRAEFVSKTPELTDEEFKEVLSILNNLGPEVTHKAFKVVLNRLWRIGDRDVVAKVVEELVQYLEEDYL